MWNKKYVSHFSLASGIYIGYICFFFAAVACRVKRNYIDDNQNLFDNQSLKNSGQSTLACIPSLPQRGTLESSLGAGYHPQLLSWIPLYRVERWLVGVGYYGKQISHSPSSIAFSMPACNLNNNYTGNHLLVHEEALFQTNPTKSLYKSFSVDKPMLTCIRRFAERGLLEGFLPVGYNTEQLIREPLHIVEGWLVGVDYGKQRLIFPPFAAIQYIIDTGKENNFNLNRSAPRDIRYEPRLLALMAALDCRSLEAVKLLTFNLRKAEADRFFKVGGWCTADQNAIDSDSLDETIYSSNMLFHLADNMIRDMEDTRGEQRPYDWEILKYYLSNNKVDPTSQEPKTKDNILHTFIFSNDEDAVAKLLGFYEEMLSGQKSYDRATKLSCLDLFYKLLHSRNIEDKTPLNFARLKLGEKGNGIISLLENADRFIERQHAFMHFGDKPPITCTFCKLYPFDRCN